MAQLQRLVVENFPKAEFAARRAIALDPRIPDAYTALGNVQRGRGQELDAEQSFKQAFSLDPLNPENLHLYSQFLSQVGRIKEAVAMREQLRGLDPLVPVFNISTAVTLLAAGDNAQAISIAEGLPLNNAQRALVIAEINAAMHKYNEAADAMLNAPRELYPPEAIEAAAHLLRIAPAPAPRQDIPYLGAFSFVFNYIGLPVRALEYAEQVTNAGYTYAQFQIFWSSDYADVRKTDQFKALARKKGLVDYWRAKGWPQFCRPTTGDDFACN